MLNPENKSYNRLYGHPLFSKIDSAQQQLSGSHYIDHESGQEFDFPPMNKFKFRNAYQYCFNALPIFIEFADTFKEIMLIRTQIQHSQDFALQNGLFTTEEILSFSYKNWIIRVNMITEKMFEFANHIYQLQLSNVDTIKKVFEHQRVKADNTIYLALLSLADFLYDNTLEFAKTKSLKKSRNQIVHNSKFEHSTISRLSFELIYSKYSIDRMDDEDLYLLEGQTSEKIKNEISELSNRLLSKCSDLLNMFEEEFDRTYSRFFKEGSDMG